MSKNTQKILITALVLIIFSGLGVGAWYLGENQKLDLPNLSSENKSKPADLNLDSAKLTTRSLIEMPLFSGKIKKLDKDLGVLRPSNFGTVYDQNGKEEPQEFGKVTYYEAGQFLSGKYKDFTRVLATEPAPVGVGQYNYFFATQDFTKFTVLNYSDIKGVDKSRDTIQKIDPDNVIFDDSKILGVDYISFELPEVIKFDTAIGANIQDLSTFQPDKGDLELLLDLGKLRKLNFPAISNDIYTLKQVADNSPQTQPTTISSYDTQGDEYTSVIIFDSAGLPYKYSLAWNSDLENLSQENAKFAQAWQKYDLYDQNRKALSLKLNPKGDYNELIDQKIEQELGKSPDYPTTRGYKLDFDNSLLKLSGTEKTYIRYGKAFPGFCGSEDISTKSNLKEDDLEQIATTNTNPVYKLKDKNHPLYREQFTAKTVQAGGDGLFESANPGVKKPTFEEYVANNPLLFFKDPFGRMVVVGEYQYLLEGGCGKPVIYLYPKQEMAVNVRFLAPMQLTTDIPKYNSAQGWNVLAQPDSQLKDLQPKYTNCDIIDTGHFGSEYAQNACQKNSYPYIYWSGNRLGAKYPKQNQGWIITKNEIPSFLNAKLDELGLNQKEKTDMMEYWVPYLQAKKGEYFRMSFLQNKELDTLLPTQITPKPNKYFRIFLDWDSFDQKPTQEIQPQVLNKLTDRSGFTAVEWGGLKK